MPRNVHHAVVYVRPPDRTGYERTCRDTLHGPSPPPHEDQRDAMWTDSDILLVYAPGSTPDQWPAGMAKFVPGGSDLVFQMHYTTNGHAGPGPDRMGLIFAKNLRNSAS